MKNEKEGEKYYLISSIYMAVKPAEMTTDAIYGIFNRLKSLFWSVIKKKLIFRELFLELCQNFVW